jgi:hypothetical protein
MSLIDGFMLKISSCFAGRREDMKEGGINNINGLITQKNYTSPKSPNKNKIFYEESFQSQSEDSLKSDSILFTDNSHLYNLKKIIDFLSTEGISTYIVNSFSVKRKVKIINIKFEFKEDKSLILLKSSKSQKDIALDLVTDVIEVIYGCSTANFVLISEKLDLVPWRCVSIITKNYETYDFIFENDEECFYVLTLLYVFRNLKVRENISNFSSIKINSIVSKLFWQKCFMKVKFNKYNNYQ